MDIREKTLKEKTCLDCKWYEINDDNACVCIFLRKHEIYFLPVFIMDKFHSSDAVHFEYSANSCQTFEDRE